ncbi:hypothetical protein B0H65DRAFT_140204 [Neurospora tetraspora]|uniref:Uncharacterized protein n=1 Tax=Neurospora tetraspora TaxID=94610 RepID=A0AAE0JLN1_9PEZI|nr:hypothetical protein B0H65DRAFT_140204 [Neurospora tetraspora]
MSTSTPVFSFGQVQEPSPFSNTNTNNHNSNSNTTTTPSFPSFTTSFSSPYQPQYRPKISSPLSSSPIRPFDSMSRSSPPGSPTSKPRGIFGGQSQSQSSPIFGSFLQSQGQGQGQGQGEASGQNGQAAADGQQEQGQNNKFLKYNSRPARPMNHPSFSSNRKEDRRRLFLQNVRQRADDKAWERRGGENELLKLEWLRFNRELRLAKEASAPPNPFNFNPQYHTDSLLEQEIEELAQLRAKFNHQQQFLEGLLEDQPPPGTEQGEQEKYQDMDDAYMADMIAREEEAELEALLALNQQAQEDLRVRGGQQGQGQQQQGDEFMEKEEEEDEYDALFMEVLAQQQQQQQGQQQQQPNGGGDPGIQHHHHSQDDVEMGG